MCSLNKLSFKMLFRITKITENTFIKQFNGFQFTIQKRKEVRKIFFSVSQSVSQSEAEVSLADAHQNRCSQKHPCCSLP